MRSYTDIWQISKQGRKGNARWGKPELVEGINTDFSDGVVTFNKRFSVMYFTQCNNKDGKALNCKIYEARKSGKGWEVNFEEPLSFCKDSFTYGHPALSPDGKSILITEGTYCRQINAPRSATLTPRCGQAQAITAVQTNVCTYSFTLTDPRACDTANKESTGNVTKKITASASKSKAAKKQSKLEKVSSVKSPKKDKHKYSSDKKGKKDKSKKK